MLSILDSYHLIRIPHALHTSTHVLSILDGYHLIRIPHALHTSTHVPSIFDGYYLICIPQTRTLSPFIVLCDLHSENKSSFIAMCIHLKTSCLFFLVFYKFSLVSFTYLTDLMCAGDYNSKLHTVNFVSRPLYAECKIEICI